MPDITGFPTTNVDNETIILNGSSQIAVQLDNTTLEYDAVNKVQIKGGGVSQSLIATGSSLVKKIYEGQMSLTTGNFSAITGDYTGIKRAIITLLTNTTGGGNEQTINLRVNGLSTATYMVHRSNLLATTTALTREISQTSFNFTMTRADPNTGVYKIEVVIVNGYILFFGTGLHIGTANAIQVCNGMNSTASQSSISALSIAPATANTIFEVKVIGFGE